MTRQQWGYRDLQQNKKYVYINFVKLNKKGPLASKRDPSLHTRLPWVTPFKTPLKIKIRNKKLFKTVFLVKILIETCLSTNKSSNLNKKIGIQLSHQKWSNQTEFLLEPVNRIQNVGSRARSTAPGSPGEPETRDSRDSRSLNWVREPRPRADLGLREIWVHRRA